jgi:CRP-like cAMP-binding protein
VQGTTARLFPEMSLTELLREQAIFRKLDETHLGELAARCITRTVGAGHVLFATGDQCRGLYILESGRVRIYRTNSEGREQVLRVEGPRKSVAELPLFDGGRYPASAVTLEESRLVFLPRAAFEQLYRSNPDVADAVIRTLGERMRRLVQITETLAFRDVAARLALLLSNYAERDGVHTDSGVELFLERTQEEISLEIGTARESVSRAFRQLRRRGLVETLEGSRLRIPDPARLRAMARES